MVSEPMIDIHCHVLPGIDDGPRTIEGSVALTRTAAAAGITTLVATPHVDARYRNDAETIARLVGELNARLGEEGIDVEILPGAEIAITHLAELDPGELPRLGLGGSGWLLVEPPFSPVAPGLEAQLLELRRRGHRLVLAHPERCPAFRRDDRTLRSLAEAGVLMSITAGSLAGRFGGEVRRRALSLAAEGLIHDVTSDAHDETRRRPGLAEETEQAGLGPLSEWLTTLVPAAILADQPIPPRPDVSLPAHRRRIGFLRRR
jgi:protein-tyrosine phosphatase